MKRAAIMLVAVLVPLLGAALATPLPSDAATKVAPQMKSDQKSNVDQETARKLGCELLKEQPSSNAICLKTVVEAWYHSVASDLDVLPITGAPTVNPYAEDTLHVGVSASKEESRTYLTLDLDELPFGATVTGGTLVLPLEQEESSGPEEADIKVCYVPEPPEKGQEGSLDTPPKTDCSEFSNALYRKKPRPMFTVDLAPFLTLFEGGVGGLALLPTNAAEQEGAMWHAAFYARKNKSEDSVAIAAAVEFVKLDLDLLPPPEPSEDFDGEDDVVGPSEGDDFVPPATGSAGFPLDSSGAVGDGVPTDASPAREPVDVGSDVAAPAVFDLGPRYSAIWYLPLALLVGTAFLGHVLTRKIEID